LREHFTQNGVATAKEEAREAIETAIRRLYDIQHTTVPRTLHPTTTLEEARRNLHLFKAIAALREAENEITRWATLDQQIEGPEAGDW
jgi:hypothetical protein